MSMEAILEVNEAQKKAEMMIAEQTKKAKALLAEAEEAGTALLAGVRSQAAEKTAAGILEAEAAARAENDAILQKAEKECGALSKASGQKVEAAAAKIVERIVSG